MQTRKAPLGGLHLAVVSAVLVLVVFLAVSLMWSPIMERYLLTVTAPPLELEFGFKAAYVTASDASGTSRAFAITQLVPGGQLENAGFEVGGLLSVGACRFNGDYVKAAAFFDDLHRVTRGETVTFGVARRDAKRYEYRTVRLAASGYGRPGTAQAR